MIPGASLGADATSVGPVAWSGMTFGAPSGAVHVICPVTAGALGMAPARFYAVNIPAVLIWAPLHVLPGVMAVSLLDRYDVFRHTSGSAKHHWIPIVIAAALIIWLAIWTIRRRHGGGLIEPANPAE